MRELLFADTLANSPAAELFPAILAVTIAPGTVRKVDEVGEPGKQVEYADYQEGLNAWLSESGVRRGLIMDSVKVYVGQELLQCARPRSLLTLEMLAPSRHHGTNTCVFIARRNCSVPALCGTVTAARSLCPITQFL